MLYATLLLQVSLHPSYYLCSFGGPFLLEDIVTCFVLFILFYFYFYIVLIKLHCDIQSDVISWFLVGVILTCEVVLEMVGGL